MRKFRRSRRAVSPVLSTVILVLIVVIGMSAVFAFFVDYVSDYQRGQGSSVMELLEIEDVRFVANDSVEVWLYNYGDIEMEVDAAYVDGLSVNLTYFHTDWSLEPYEHKRFTVTLVEDWQPDFSYIFKFVTERGSTVERSYFAPS
jgi:flagellin-like protein